MNTWIKDGMAGFDDSGLHKRGEGSSVNGVCAQTSFQSLTPGRVEAWATCHVLGRWRTREPYSSSLPLFAAFPIWCGRVQET